SGALAATALQSPQLGLFQQSSEGSSSNGQSSRDGQASPDGQSSAEAQVPSHGGAQPPGQVPSHGQGPSQGQDQSPFQQAPSQGQDPSQTQPGAQASSELDQEPASAEESTGIVLIETELGYQSAAADGTVMALDASLTTTAEGMTESESLSGMIEVDADIVSGDSGGALLDADGDVVGINTAASQGSANVTGYAIPIDRALDVAQ